MLSDLLCCESESICATEGGDEMDKSRAKIEKHKKRNIKCDNELSSGCCIISPNLSFSESLKQRHKQ